MRSPAGPSENPRRNQLLFVIALLGVTLAVLFHQAFQSNFIMWANDGPLGAIESQSSSLPSGFHGRWQDLEWVGMPMPNAAPTISTIGLMILRPVMYMKLWAPFTLLLLGFCAWVFFKQMGFSPPVCILCALAAGLNMHFFSVACWGLSTWDVCFAMVFLSLAAVVSTAIRQLWLKGALGGLALGMGVMEGFDSGAILSFYVAFFAVFLCFIGEEKGGRAKGFFKGVLLAVLMAAFAFFISVSKLSTIIDTQVTGSSREAAVEKDKDSNWNFATKWSIPKLETLRIVIPGIFGYRMREDNTAADKSNSYWGHVAEDHTLELLESEDPSVRAAAGERMHGLPDQIEALKSSDPDIQDTARQAILAKHPLQRRHSGNGDYAGIMTAILACFAVVASLRGAGSAFSPRERWIIWFWSAAALFSLVASWGKHAFLYTLLYHAVPYFASMRNPLKFMHPFEIAWIILAGFGLEALHRRYFQKAQGFNKACAVTMGLLVGGVAVGWMIYDAHQPQVAHYLRFHGFSTPADMPVKIAKFSAGEVGVFVIYFAIAAALFLAAVSGVWAGSRAKLGWIILGAFIIIDMGRGDRPWIWYYDYTEKYESNDLLDFLKTSPDQYRVTAKLGPNDGSYSLSGAKNFAALCHWWLENDFPADNIQSIDIDQWPRMPLMDTNFLSSFYIHTNIDWTPSARLWQLTSTRYVMCASGMEPLLNQRACPGAHDFRIRATYSMPHKTGLSRLEDAGDLTVVSDPLHGQFALIEYDKALPHAKLFSDWQALNDSDALAMLKSPQFDPAKKVVVAADGPVPPSNGRPDADPGTVDITRYEPKDVKLTATAQTPAVLMLTDRVHPSWKAWVDDKPAPIIRCNYLMRGVYLEPGRHLIEFRFEPPTRLLYVSLLALFIGMGLLGYLAFTDRAASLATAPVAAPPPSPNLPLQKRSGKANPKAGQKPAQRS